MKITDFSFSMHEVILFILFSHILTQYSKIVKTEIVFTEVEMDKEKNVYFHQNSPLGI